MSHKDLLNTPDSLETVFLPKVEKATRERMPIFFDKSDVQIFREALVEAGVNLELTQLQREYLQGKQFRAKPLIGSEGEVVDILVFDRRLPKPKEGESEYRWISISKLTDDDFADHKMFLFPKDKIKDKGFAVIASLGRTKFAELITKGYEEAVKKGLTDTVGYNEGTEGRGAYHFVGKILEAALLDLDSPDFDLALAQINGEINTRRWAGYLETLPHSDKRIVNESFKEAGVAHPTKEKSFPPVVFPELIKFMTGRSNDFGKATLPHE